ncbi:hypothetical protein VTK73DRAFT_10224 [Phialemonium thermophilum]|uniref:Zn(2)-C6 fungal-type domain-containing protein n=1 Tax=Phialemonium thermophilum TaxID=223376 RepID=A0ABR3XH68_9PEZI
MELSILASTAAEFQVARPHTAHSRHFSAHAPSVADFAQRNYTSLQEHKDMADAPRNTEQIMAAPSSASAAPNHGCTSPGSSSAPPKCVAFELLFTGSPQFRARLPLRVSIFPHDTTDSIVTTVKNFYGLYSGPTVSKGVSFEDEHGNTLIARYENFRDNMVVYVRVIEEVQPAPGSLGPHQSQPTPNGAQPLFNGDGHPLLAGHPSAQDGSRPPSPTSRRRSPSPNSRGRRSASAGTSSGHSKKGRSRSSKTRRPGSQANIDDGMTGYSSGDGAPGSASGKAKEHLGNTEISVDNIVEGGRRKRAKFESSELPLFAPPQMPAATSNSSISPARRVEHHHRNSLPFVPPSHNPFTNPRPPLQSPQSYGAAPNSYGSYATPGTDDRRTRSSVGYTTGIPGMGILPTPDPTVGSCMSEEDKDVAIQLMRLGDISNISHGRTSASTLDDTFSGRADAASSTGATSEDESDSDDSTSAAGSQKLGMPVNYYSGMFAPAHRHPDAPRQSVEANGEDFYFDEVDGRAGAANSKFKTAKPKANTLNTAKPRSQLPSAPRSRVAKPTKSKARKSPSVAGGPISPASLPAASRKPSLASNVTFPAAPGEEEQPDLSTKPRCQRCRKSKKGCDRQRPCGRCRDAGIPADQCISEDEGNGRKGRYGRHMGVPIKKEDVLPPPPILLPAAPIAPAPSFQSAVFQGAEKSKKRKR